MARHIDVWLLGEHVGTLSQVGGRLRFSYLPSYLARYPSGLGATPLSWSLPLRAPAYDDAETRPFFAGLLPEGRQRRVIARTLGVTRQNDFALLDSLGGECAGAVSLLETGQEPPPIEGRLSVRWLSPSQLQKVLKELPLRPMLAGDAGLRLSLAGAQDKLPVVLGTDGMTIGLPLNGFPSSHIIKPAIAGLHGSVVNEGYCLALAGALGLEVAKARIISPSLPDAQDMPHPYLLVQRYDRQANQAQARLHQEDFCQALGLAPETKYQAEGGPCVAQCFELLRSATRPSAPHILKLLDAIIFNALMGNHDAHGKNFSLLYTSKGTQLAPLYDLLCTAVYPRLTEKMAMKIGGKYRFSEVKARHWEQFALEASLSPALVKKRVLTIAQRLPELANDVQTQFEAQGQGHAIIGTIKALVEHRCALSIRCLAAPV